MDDNEKNGLIRRTARPAEHREQPQARLDKEAALSGDALLFRKFSTPGVSVNELCSSFRKRRAEKAGDEEKPGGSAPSLYAFPVGAVELQDLIEHRNMNFAVGNIFKACYRLGQKEGVDAAYDLRKILFFAERELRRVEAMNGKANS